MNVIHGLAREHQIFSQLIERIEKSLGYDEKLARVEVREMIIVLLLALDKHEQVEETVFGHPSYASREDAKKILGEVEFEHHNIEKLRLELLEAVNADGSLPFKRLKDLIGQLMEKLRSHFHTEEKRLWPHYENFSRSLDASIRRRLEQKVDALENDIEANHAAVMEYLERK